MIEINELTKRYEDRVLALDHVTYKVEQGEIFCLLGANGAGKTTTINILLDFIPPTSGQAFINGHDCNKFPPRSQKVCILCLRECAALRDVHGKAESGVLCRAGRQNGTQKEGL